VGALQVAGHDAFAAHFPELAVIEECGCRDTFCQSFYTAPKPDGPRAWSLQCPSRPTVARDADPRCRRRSHLLPRGNRPASARLMEPLKPWRGSSDHRQIRQSHAGRSVGDWFLPVMFRQRSVRLVTRRIRSRLGSRRGIPPRSDQLGERGGSTRVEHDRVGVQLGEAIDDCEYPQFRDSNRCPEGDLPTRDTHLRHLAPG
jgi:hypothetical protein